MFPGKTIDVMNSCIICFDDVFRMLSTNLTLSCYVRTMRSSTVEILSISWRYLTDGAVLTALYVGDDHLLLIVTDEVD
jgi:hypothetical protein